MEEVEGEVIVVAVVVAVVVVIVVVVDFISSVFKWTRRTRCGTSFSSTNCNVWINRSCIPL